MTDKNWVIHFCSMMRLMIIRPTRADKVILIMHETPGMRKVLFDGTTWKEAKQYLQEWLLIRVA